MCLLQIFLHLASIIAYMRMTKWEDKSKMLYKPFHERKLSWLGMGNMRLPKLEGQGEAIDERSARQLIEYAYENGINYFDTAYRYHAGASEPFVGEVLKQYPRDSWYLATKMPGHMMAYNDGEFAFTGMLEHVQGLTPSQIFEQQLERCGVDYFDFYLLHNVCETAFEFYTDARIRVVEYLQEQQKAGRIRYLGFSAHGSPENIEQFLQVYPNVFSFAQIQLNYLDWTLQQAKEKYEVLTSHGIPVIAMEPCRGGRLADLGEDANAILRKARPDHSVARWAFRFLQSLPNVQIVLSGMSTLEQLQENIEIFSKADPTNENENTVLQQVAEQFLDSVPCTACRYCTEGCPQGLDIPKLIALYNQSKHDPPFLMRFAMDAMPQAALPAACVLCGSCAKVCPQAIAIPDIMETFSKTMAGWNM